MLAPAAYAIATGWRPDTSDAALAPRQDINNAPLRVREQLRAVVAAPHHIEDLRLFPRGVFAAPRGHHESEGWFEFGRARPAINDLQICGDHLHECPTAPPACLP